MSKFTGFAKRDLAMHPPRIAPAYRSSLSRGPKHKPIAFPNTMTECTGPSFGHDLLGPYDNDLLLNYAPEHGFEGGQAIGPRIMVHGRLQDGEGRPVSGALIEVWQANAGGRYRHKNDGYLAPLDPNFGGCGRMITDDAGHYSFRTVLPGAYPWPNGGNDWRPSHIHFSVFGTAFAQRLITQMYFEGDPHIARCPIAQSIPDKAALDRLIARLDMNATQPMDIRAYRFDIVLRGRRATMFENQLEGL